MIFKNVSSWIPAAVLALVAALGGTLWVLRPEEGVTWAVSALFLPAAWLVLELAGKTRLGPSLKKDGLGYTGALAVGGAIVAASLGFTLAETLGWVGDSTSSRGMGFVMGLFLVLVGNVMPKLLKPLTAMRCDPAKVQSFQRSAGWIFVLAGIGYAAAWLVLPIETAGLVSTLFAFASVALVAPRLAWLYIRRGAPPRSVGG